MTIDSEEEKNWLFSFIKDSSIFDVNREVLTSGVKVNDTWVWKKNEAPIKIKLNWSKGQPDNHDGKENCITLQKTGNKFEDISFNDYYCDYVNVPFICQEKDWVLPGFIKLGEYSEY